MKRKADVDLDMAAKKASTENIKVTVTMSKNDIIDGCVEMVTVNGRPFKALNDSGFLKITKPLMQAMGTTVNAENVPDYVKEKAEAIRAEIAADVKDKLVCVKSDTATRLGRSFLGVNIQYSKNGRLVPRTLAVSEIKERHTSVNLKKRIVDVLGTVGIIENRIYASTTDNASNMLKITDLLNEAKVPAVIEETDDGIQLTSDDEETEDESSTEDLLNELDFILDVQKWGV